MQSKICCTVLLQLPDDKLVQCPGLLCCKQVFQLLSVCKCKCSCALVCESEKCIVTSRQLTIPTVSRLTSTQASQLNV